MDFEIINIMNIFNTDLLGALGVKISHKDFLKKCTDLNVVCSFLIDEIEDKYLNDNNSKLHNDEPIYLNKYEKCVFNINETDDILIPTTNYKYYKSNNIDYINEDFICKNIEDLKYYKNKVIIEKDNINTKDFINKTELLLKKSDSIPIPPIQHYCKTDKELTYKITHNS